MGGGKTKTMTNLGSAKFFDQDDNLFQKDLVRIAGFMGGINAPNIGEELVRGIGTYFSFKKFEKFGMVPIVDGIVKNTTTESILNYLVGKTTINPSYTVYSKSIDYILENNTLSQNINFLKYLAASGVADSLNTSYSNTFTYYGSYTINIPYGNIKTVNDGGTNYAATLRMDGDFPYMEIQLSGMRKVFFDYTKSSVVYSYEFLIPDIVDPVMIIAYGQTGSWFMTHCNKSELVEVEEPKKFFFMPMKKNGTIIDDKMTKVFLHDFGIKFNDLTEDDSDFLDRKLKEIALSYSAKKDGSNISFNSIKNEHVNFWKTSLEVNTNNGLYLGATVTLMSVSSDPSRQYILKYSYKSGDENSGEFWSLTKDGYSVYIDPNEDVWLVPINYLDEMPLDQKYIFLKECFTYLMISQETIKLKWYQTGLFKIFSFIVSAVLSVWTGGASLKMWMIATVVTMVATAISPKLGAIVGIAFIVYGAYSGGPMTNFQMAITVVNIANSLSGLYFQLAGEKIQDGISQYQAEQKKLQEEISKMKGDMIYQPIDSTQAFYDIVCGELVYAHYDDAFSYDNFYDFSPNKGMVV